MKKTKKNQVKKESILTIESLKAIKGGDGDSADATVASTSMAGISIKPPIK